MKILIVDYLSYAGHKRFNKIHIDALSSLNHELFFVGKKEQFPPYCQSKVVCEPPEFFFKTFPVQGLSSRIQNFLCLKWIYKRINEKDYDLIIFPTYDIVSLFFSPFKQKCFVINHNNIGQLDSKVKLWMTRHLSSFVSHITLDLSSKKRLQQLVTDASVFMVPHGYDRPSSDIERPKWLDSRNFLFCPVNRNFDHMEVEKLISNTGFRDSLTIHKACLYLKNYDVTNDTIIKSIPSNIPQKEYDYLIQNAKAVILPYNHSFCYRVSGIFFECIAANTFIVAPNIDSFNQYGDQYVYLYNDENDFSKCVSAAFGFVKNKRDMSRFDPTGYWKDVLSSLN